MAAAQTAVGVGRALRQDTGLRTRQPLGRLLLHADDGRAAALLDDPRLAAILREELNVKAAEPLADPRTVAQLTGKANFRALGPRFGKGAPAAAKAIAAMTPDQLLVLRREGSVSLEVDGRPESFGHEEVQVVEQGIPPYAAGSQDGLTVALDTTLTPVLRDEGLSREIINRVQNLRKKSGLDVADRIRLQVAGDDDVTRALAAHSDHVASETLAAWSTDDDLPHRDEFEVDGHAVRVALARRERE